MRKVITLTANLFDKYQLSDWRQHVYNVRHVKRLMRIAQNRCYSACLCNALSIAASGKPVLNNADY
jgi:hypothetical protein